MSKVKEVEFTFTIMTNTYVPERKKPTVAIVAAHDRNKTIDILECRRGDVEDSLSCIQN